MLADECPPGERVQQIRTLSWLCMPHQDQARPSRWVQPAAGRLPHTPSAAARPPEPHRCPPDATAAWPQIVPRHVVAKGRGPAVVRLLARLVAAHGGVNAIFTNACSTLAGLCMMEGPIF